MPRLRSRLTLTANLLVAALLALAPQAHADAMQDIGRLMKQGQLPQALSQADQYLASYPRDPQARFLKGLILTEMNRPQEAIVVFTKLTEEFPESPEPYNNLAVIYAQQKQYDKARQALEMAIRTHPSYATAHENLGDIYAHMASQAYDKALSIDSSITSAQTKLQMVRDMMTGTPSTMASRKPAKPTTVAAAPAAPAPVARPTPATPPPAATPEPATPPPAPAAKPATRPAEPVATSSEQVAVSGMVNDWAAAWAGKNVKAYLSHYASDFRTPRGMSRSAWEKQRHDRIDKPGSIQVEIENLQVSMEGSDRASARFRQHYRAAGLKSSTNKTLKLVKNAGKWQIQQELVR